MARRSFRVATYMRCTLLTRPENDLCRRSHIFKIYWALSTHACATSSRDGATAAFLTGRRSKLRTGTLFNFHAKDGSVNRVDTPNPKSHNSNPKSYTPNPKSYTPNPKPHTSNPESYTPKPKTYTSNTNSYTPNPKSYTPNPKSYTPNPISQTLNPIPPTLNLRIFTLGDEYTPQR